MDSEQKLALPSLVKGNNEECSTSIVFSVVNKRLRRSVAAFMLIALLMQISALVAIFSNYHSTRPLSAIDLAIFLMPLAFLITVFWVSARQAKASLVLDQTGIQFSKAWRLQLLNRLKRDWKDLHSVQIVFPQTYTRIPAPLFSDDRLRWTQLFFSSTVGPILCFDFKSGGSATLNLNNITRAQAETLFDSIEKQADPSRFSTEFVKMQKALVMEKIDPVSFTQLWAEDIKPRYCATNYVPLPTNHTLDGGRYKVLLELAAGGMSAVYLAKTESGGKVVLKESVIPSDINVEQKEKAAQLFEREAHLLLKLKHPKIARVLDRFVDTGRDYLVLEYIPGLTLRQLVAAKGKQKEKDVLKWAKQLAEILIYLHGQNPPLLHRDLTPDNIILKEDGSIFLVDFGAANEFIGKATGTMIGKQCYIAPEQLRGKATCASDLYALGATIYFLTTGEDPEPLSCSSPKAKNQNVSEKLNALVVSLTAFEAEERPNSAEQVLSELESNQPIASGKLSRKSGESA